VIHTAPTTIHGVIASRPGKGKVDTAT